MQSQTIPILQVAIMFNFVLNWVIGGRTHYFPIRNENLKKISLLINRIKLEKKEHCYFTVSIPNNIL